MVKVVFTDWHSFFSCPVWWRNFVNSTCEGISGLSCDTDIRYKALSDGLAAYDAVMVPEEGHDHNIDYIEFKTNEDYLAFVLRWM